MDIYTNQWKIAAVFQSNSEGLGVSVIKLQKVHKFYII